MTSLKTIAPGEDAALFAPAGKLVYLKELERRVLWLATWMIHHANHIRPSRDGLKVGGHQASCASVVTLLTALYFDVLVPEDRVAVKPHGSPVYHAIQYILGRQDKHALANFRALGGAQAYPSRTKDKDDVDFTTGSVGLGVGATLFASIAADYVRLHRLAPDRGRKGRMIAVMGDGELDEGNVFEALLEGWKHDVRDLWWIIDYNRQSLDGIVSDRLFRKIHDFFKTVGWRVEILKYGKSLQRAFEGPAGGALRKWIDDCPNDLYSALTFKGGPAWRQRLQADLSGTSGLKTFLDGFDDGGLDELMTDLAGHDMATLLAAFHGVTDDAPRCFVAYTVKGFGLPLAGHKDNHAGLMTVAQMERFKRSMGIPDGAEWRPLANLGVPEDELARFLESVPFNRAPGRRYADVKIAVPDLADARSAGAKTSTQTAFGRILGELGKGKSELARRIVTTSADVTVSTNLGGWVNRRGLFARQVKEDVFKAEKVASTQKWEKGPGGQHIELGVAENNLFLLLGVLGLSAPLFGARLIPIGTVYDTFIARGLDALNYGCYQDARFMVVATPSGLTLAPEGGAHQSILEPMIGMSQSGLSYFEPAFADELAWIMGWSFDHMQAAEGSSVYLRLSTRAIEPPERRIDAALGGDIIAGAYWQRPPAPGADFAIAYTGAVAPEAMDAFEQLRDDLPGAGLLAIPSPDRLHAEWSRAAKGGRARGAGRVSHVERLLGRLAPDAAIVTVIDGHPATLSWLGSVAGHRAYPLGVTAFGQSGDIPDLYRLHGLDADAILDACANACLDRVRRRT